MPSSLFEQWCETEDLKLEGGHNLHVFREKDGVRSSLEKQIAAAVVSHYEDPLRLSERIAKVGLPKAAQVLREMLPRTSRTRSGHLGEILAAEAAPAVLKNFEIPIKRLRWLDGREAALRGEDLIGVERTRDRVRFLKGESKSRGSLSPGVVAEAREMLAANDGRPSQHALTFIMHRLFELQQEKLALVFEEFLLLKPIPTQQLVHLLFAFSGNDASNALAADLKGCSAEIEQHAIALRITDHPKFIAAVYDRLDRYGSDD
jgi:hypothetical protein